MVERQESRVKGEMRELIGGDRGRGESREAKSETCWSIDEWSHDGASDKNIKSTYIRHSLSLYYIIIEF